MPNKKGYITVTELRANIYQYLDSVLETGEPIVIERGGRRLVIKPLGKKES